MTERILTGLDRIDGCIGERAHCTRYETDQHVLVIWKLLEVGLKLGCQLFKLLVYGEVDT